MNYTRTAAAVLAVALSAAAAVERLRPPEIANEAVALQRDNASPYRWADLGEAYAREGHPAEARRCFDRALELAPNIPAIWLRDANLKFLQDDPAGALQSAARVLRTVPDYDGVLFNYFDQMVDDPARVLASIGDQRRATRSWLGHLMGSNNESGARLAWAKISQAGYTDPPLTASYLEYLLRRHRWTEAVSVWSAVLGDRRGDYPIRNLLFNGDFRSTPQPGPLDWQINNNSDQFETVREGGGVRIHFGGTSNVNYDNLSQIAVLPKPGRYRLTMRVKTEGLTTNETIRLAVTDLNLKTDPLPATQNWQQVELDFATSEPRSVRIAVIRQPSQKFDNKIQGTAWIGAATLKPSYDVTSYMKMR